jgi:hypothetical protein
MENLKIYSFYDKKSERYDTPFHCFEDLHAKRHFEITSMKEGSILNTFLTEFEMYQVGEFNVITGEISALDRPRLVMSGNQLANQMAHVQNNQLELFRSQT